MGRAAHQLGILRPGSPEDRRFRGYFGVSAELALEAWDLMEEIGCLPPSSQLVHYLWALAFMRLYPANDIALSTALGGSDPKTIRKYIWPMIDSIYELSAVVVSSWWCVCPITITLHFLMLEQDFIRTQEDWRRWQRLHAVSGWH
jgi:hypothetical protein